jgi:glycosyltransferase involved in cell wall biosynthesis
MNTPSVSVVIPTFNSGRLVAEAVASALAQTVVPAEVIVVDDGSTDDTPERLAPYAGRVRYIRQENRGVSAARNRGVAEARGEFVAFLDADDVWHPRKWELQLRAFDRLPGLGMIGAQPFDWPASVFPSLPGADAPRVTPVGWRDLVVKNYLTTSSVVVRRDVLERAGRFDTALQGPEDRDLWLRVAEVAPIVNLELPLVGYRDVPGSVSKSVERCQTSMLRILRKLDEQGAWRGRRVLRRKAFSYVYHSCAYLHGAAGSYRRALACSLYSVAWYPLPYRACEVKTPGERPKRLLINLLHWLGLRSPESIGGGSAHA